MDNLVYVILAGEQEFTNKRHVENFVKYLFSCSKAHIENEETKFNFYVKKDIKDKVLNRIGFVKNPIEQCDEFLKNFEKELSNEKKLINDIYYVLFFAVGKNKIITNFFEYEENDYEIFNKKNIYFIYIYKESMEDLKHSSDYFKHILEKNKNISLEIANEFFTKNKNDIDTQFLIKSLLNKKY